MTRITAHCPGCFELCLVAVDHHTGEQVLLNVGRVDGGRVELLRPPSAPNRLVARDHVTSPAPRQPAHELHSRTCPSPVEPEPVDLSDDPVLEQTGGWRR